MSRRRPEQVTPSDDLDVPQLPGMKVSRWRGPVERSIAATVRACGHLDDRDGAAVALLRSAARAVDWCERNGERHTQALHVARMSELLTKLRLEPSSRGEGVTEPDAWDLALSTLGTPAGGDAPLP